MTEPVLVTGGSGFVGSHCIVRLLAEGYRVRTTVRNPERRATVSALVRSGGQEPDGRVDCVVADLTADAGWEQAVSGCRFVLHVASPFPAQAPADEDEVIGPARDGALRVLRFARSAGVERVVLTSSFAAGGYSPKPGVYTEQDWTDPDGGVGAYVRSKTLAERAAWDAVAGGAGPPLTVINPTGIFGPVLGPDYSPSVGLIRALLDGRMPAVPKVSFGAVDVRDVADLHVRAMRSDLAAGQRYLAVSGPAMSLHGIALALRTDLGAAARRVPARELPNALTRLLARFRPELQESLPQLGVVKQISHDKAVEQLGWRPRSGHEAVVASARSLLALDT